MKRHLIFLLIGLAFWLITGRVQAQTAVSIIRNEAKVNFPQNIIFDLETDQPITEAMLNYDVSQFSCLDAAARVPVDITGDSTTSLTWTWEMIRSGNPPPGASLWWEWELTDATGNTFTTPRQELTFSDDRFEWRLVEADGVQLYWYDGDKVGPLLLEAAVEGLGRLEQDMGIELVDTVQIYIYGDSQDMRDAVLYIQDWAGGVAFTEYGVILMGVPPSSAEGWGRRTVKHELAHLVVGQFGQSCLGGRRPTWLEEGLAVYAEGELEQRFFRAIEDGIADNNFEPVRSLNGSFPAHDEAANTAYAQSYSVVNYLLDAYGQEQMQALLLALADGAGYDNALEQVYGFNVDGLEVAWRAAIGAPARAIPATPTPILAANIPTVVPPGVPRSVPTPPAAAAPPPDVPEAEPASGLCGVGLLPLFLLGVGGISYGRRREENS